MQENKNLERLMAKTIAELLVEILKNDAFGADVDETAAAFVAEVRSPKTDPLPTTE